MIPDRDDYFLCFANAWIGIAIIEQIIQGRPNTIHETPLNRDHIDAGWEQHYRQVRVLLSKAKAPNSRAFYRGSTTPNQRKKESLG